MITGPTSAFYILLHFSAVFVLTTTLKSYKIHPSLTNFVPQKLINIFHARRLGIIEMS